MACTQGSRGGDRGRSQAARCASIARSTATGACRPLWGLLRVALHGSERPGEQQLCGDEIRAANGTEGSKEGLRQFDLAAVDLPVKRPSLPLTSGTQPAPLPDRWAQIWASGSSQPLRATVWVGRRECSLRPIFEPMSFDVAAEAYDRFMGRYSRLLSSQLGGLGVARRAARSRRRLRHRRAHWRVGRAPWTCARAAVDPSEPFVAATRERHRARTCADRRPSTCRSRMPRSTPAQLVVHFMKDPVDGLTEMRRVTRRDGIVAACVWDHGDGEGPLADPLGRGTKARPRDRG